MQQLYYYYQICMYCDMYVIYSQFRLSFNMQIIEDLRSLSVFACWTLKMSCFLVSILWVFSFFGNICIVFGFLTHFQQSQSIDSACVHSIFHIKFDKTLFMTLKFITLGQLLKYPLCQTKNTQCREIQIFSLHRPHAKIQNHMTATLIN